MLARADKFRLSLLHQPDSAHHGYSDTRNSVRCSLGPFCFILGASFVLSFVKAAHVSLRSLFVCLLGHFVPYKKVVCEVQLEILISS